MDNEKGNSSASRIIGVIMNIVNKLFENKDDTYAEFQSKLTPGIDRKLFIGVRVPILRNIAKEYFKSGEYQSFLDDIPHKYYDENMLHVLLISQIKDYDVCIKEIEKFLPYIDNWAVCDILSPKIFKKHTEELLFKIKKWVKSNQTYTIRFGIEMLQSFYLDDEFKKEYLIIPNIKSSEYYVNMMIAWFYATALTKKWDDTIKIIETQKLEKWVHNKTIQKACESYRLTPKQKDYLKTLKIK